MLTDTFDIGITLEQINYFLQSVIYVNIDVDILTEICAQEVQSLGEIALINVNSFFTKELPWKLTGRFALINFIFCLIFQRNYSGNARAVTILWRNRSH